jgi:hypothetical protein
MKNIKLLQRFALILPILSVCACATDGEKYAGVMERKIEQVRTETKEPITTLAFVQTKKSEDPAVLITQDQAALQDIESAADEESGVAAVKGIY